MLSEMKLRRGGSSGATSSTSSGGGSSGIERARATSSASELREHALCRKRCCCSCAPVDRCRGSLTTHLATKSWKSSALPQCAHQYGVRQSAAFPCAPFLLLTELWWWVAHDGPQDAHRVSRRMRRHALSQLDRRDAKRPNVALRVNGVHVRRGKATAVMRTLVSYGRFWITSGAIQ